MEFFGIYYFKMWWFFLPEMLSFGNWCITLLRHLFEKQIVFCLFGVMVCLHCPAPISVPIPLQRQRLLGSMIMYKSVSTGPTYTNPYSDSYPNSNGYCTQFGIDIIGVGIGVWQRKHTINETLCHVCSSC